MRKLLSVPALLFAAAVSAGDGGTSFWRTADQRGDQFLAQGNAVAAAKTYADPRRKGYAELQAGDYPAAARDFAPYQDSDAQYNQGNALAKSGDLKQAIGAYDHALAANPHNDDARHNRDLVEKALRQQQQQSNPANQQKQGGGQSASSKDQSDKSEGKQGQSSQSSQQGQQQGSSAGHQSQEAGQSASSKGQPGKSEGKQGEGSQSPQQEQQGASADQQSQGGGESASPKDPSANSENKSGPGAASSQNSPEQTGTAAQAQQPQVADDRAQVQRDAATAVQRATATKAPAQNAVTDSTAVDGRPTVAHPVSEQQLAEEQWLRGIPDDPGGLLQRKFMIEHLMRQQGKPL